MTEQELKEIEARANAAPTGDWRRSERSYGAYSVECFRGKGVQTVAEGCSHVSASFIAHAREDVPALIAEVRRLRGFILDADGMATAFGPNGDTATACPWCFGGGATTSHSSKCPVFTPEGELK